MKFKNQILKTNFIFLISIFCLYETVNAQQKDTIKQLPLFEVESQKIFENKPTIIVNLKKQSILNNDLSEILKLFPNISAIRRGGTALDPVMRGFRNNQILILFNDGLRIEGGCPNRMDPVTSHIPMEEVVEIEVFQGIKMLAFGPNIGGTIIIKSKYPEFSEKKLYGINLNSKYLTNPTGVINHISTFYSSKRIVFKVAAGYSKSDDYKSGNSEIFKTSYEKYSGSLKSAINITDNQTFKFHALSVFARNVMFPALPMDEKMDNTYLFNLSYNLVRNEKENLKISTYYSNVEHMMDNSFRPQFTSVVPPLNGIMQAFSNVDAINTGGNIAYHFFWKKIQFKTSAELEFIHKDGTRKRTMIMNMEGLTTTTTKFDNLWNNANILKSATSLTISKKINKNKIIEGIIRIDNSTNYSSDTFSLKQFDNLIFDNRKNSNSSLSFGFQYSVNTDFTSFSAGISRSNRNANMNELYIKRLVIGFDKFDYLGNPFLTPEINNQADLSFAIQRKDIYIKLNSFYAFVENYIGGVILPSSVIAPATQGVLGVKQFQNKGDAIFTGGEVSTTYSPHKRILMNLSSGYTYAFIKKTEKYILKDGQVIGKSVITNDPLPEIPQLSITSYIQFFFNQNLSKFEIKANYLMPQNTVSEAEYEKTTPSSLTLDIELQHTFKKFVIIKTGVKNIFNTNYYEHLNRRIVGSNDIFYEPGRCFFIQLNFSFNSLNND